MIVTSNPGRLYHLQSDGVDVRLERSQPTVLSMRCEPLQAFTDEEACALLRGLAEMLGYELGARHEV